MEALPNYPPRDVAALNVIVNLTDRCVLRCAYCFNRDQRDTSTDVLTTEALEVCIAQAFETWHEEVSFEWTGGEPLLLDGAFFDRIVALQQHYATKPYTNALQTAVPPMSRGRLEHLRALGFSLSTTLDGPVEVHDALRGAGSYDRVWGALEALGGELGFIVTATPHLLGRAKAVVEEAHRAGLSRFHCNPCVSDVSSLNLDNDSYVAFYSELMGVWLSRNLNTPRPYTLEYALACFLKGSEPLESLCTMGGRCLTNFIAVTPRGELYPCPKFQTPETLLGRLGQTPFAVALAPNLEPMSAILALRHHAVKACMERCPHAAYLNGCCPWESYVNGGFELPSVLCSGKQRLFSYMEALAVYLVDLQG